LPTAICGDRKEPGLAKYVGQSRRFAYLHIIFVSTVQIELTGAGIDISIVPRCPIYMNAEHSSRENRRSRGFQLGSETMIIDM